MEEVRFGDDGRLQSPDLRTYKLPHALDIPFFELDHTETPTPHNELGAKGAGEVATVPAAAAVGNAVCDALGVDHLDMPYTPEKVWRVLASEQGAPTGRGASRS
jgi:carbon-monoxide dehydrogenase large subunit